MTAANAKPRSAITVVDDLAPLLDGQANVLQMLSSLATIAADSQLESTDTMWPGIADIANQLHERNEQIRALIDELYEYARARQKGAT